MKIYEPKSVAPGPLDGHTNGVWVLYKYDFLSAGAGGGEGV